MDPARARERRTSPVDRQYGLRSRSIQSGHSSGPLSQPRSQLRPTEPARRTHRPTVAAVTPRIDRSRAIPSRGSAGWVGRAILFVLRLGLADGDASAVRKPRASSTRPGRKTIGRGANEQRAATVVMAAAPECHRVAFKAGASVCVGPSARSQTFV